MFDDILSKVHSKDAKICILGLGYVGLPLAVEFGKSWDTVGYDINMRRIDELKSGYDFTLEVDVEDLKSAKKLSFTNELSNIGGSDIFIVTVPTPLDGNKKPDLRPLFDASKSIAQVLKKGNIVIYESTVYPGATEEDCVPIIEEYSGLKFNKEFYVGYSPERINPGDKTRRLKDIQKIVSGSTDEIAECINILYQSIVSAGTHVAPSIRTAEAAKIIENTQRDLNIALMNELSKIFDKLDIDTQAVITAASTKWNFIPFQPGLVGGHCIGVDPYYLTHKAEAIGYYPEIILSGRRVNDGMGAHIAQQMIKLLLQREIKVLGAKILIMGLTFKENCPDLRNTRVVDVLNELIEFGAQVEVFDPWCDSEEAKMHYNIGLQETLGKEEYDGIIVTVAHKEFKDMGVSEIRSLCKKKHVLYDVKSIFDINQTDARL